MEILETAEMVDVVDEEMSTAEATAAEEMEALY